MSEFYTCGQIVVYHSFKSRSSGSGRCSSQFREAGPANYPTALPINNLYPLMGVIVDCSQSSGLPIAYIPYRVYAGDEVIAKMTDSGWALIPQDMCIKAIFDGTNNPSATITVSETASYKGKWCYGPSCSGYRKTPGLLCLSSPGVATGFLTSKCGLLGDRGTDVWGWDSRFNTNNKMTVISPNAFEYLEFSTNTPISSSDWVGFAIGTTSAANCKISQVSSNLYRVEAYPGYGGKFGLSAIEGGTGQIAIIVSIGGGINMNMYGWGTRAGVYRWVAGEYSAQSRTLTITLKYTGRYGNYR